MCMPIIGRDICSYLWDSLHFFDRHIHTHKHTEKWTFYLRYLSKQETIQHNKMKKYLSLREAFNKTNHTILQNMIWKFQNFDCLKIKTKEGVGGSEIFCSYHPRGWGEFYGRFCQCQKFFFEDFPNTSNLCWGSLSTILSLTPVMISSSAVSTTSTPSQGCTLTSNITMMG